MMAVLPLLNISMPVYLSSELVIYNYTFCLYTRTPNWYLPPVPVCTGKILRYRSVSMPIQTTQETCMPPPRRQTRCLGYIIVTISTCPPLDFVFSQCTGLGEGQTWLFSSLPSLSWIELQYQCTTSGIRHCRHYG